MIALADLLAHALHRPAHSLVLAVLSLIGQVDHDLLAGYMRRDRLAAPAMSLAFVS